MINRGRSVTLVLLDTLSSKHNNYLWIRTLWTCSCVWGIGATVLLTLKFQFSIHINNFQLTGDPFKLVKIYNLCSLL